MAGVDILDVPYKGGGQALTDLLGGQVGLSLIVAGNEIKHANAGKLVALAVTSDTRNAAAPDVPTLAESGYPEFALVNWYVILAPAGTPAAAVARLNREIGAGDARSGRGEQAHRGRSGLGRRHTGAGRRDGAARHRTLPAHDHA